MSMDMGSILAEDRHNQGITPKQGFDPNELSGIMSSPGLCANDSYLEK